MAHATIKHPICWTVFCITPNYRPRWRVGSSWRCCQQRLVQLPMSVKPWHSVLYTFPPRPIPVIKLFQQSHLGLASRGCHEADNNSKNKLRVYVIWKNWCCFNLLNRNIAIWSKKRKRFIGNWLKKENHLPSSTRNTCLTCIYVEHSRLLPNDPVHGRPACT